MKKMLLMLLCVMVLVSVLADMRTYASGDYGKEVNFKPTASSKKYSSDAADELGITLYESAQASITSFEVSCTLQRILNQVEGANSIPSKAITKLTNYKDMADKKLVGQIYYVGALKTKNKRILVNSVCTKLELARQFAYYDEYFVLYEERKAVNLVDTKSAYAKYAYQAGLLDAPSRRFYPDEEITLEDFLEALIKLQENSSIKIEDDDIQDAIVKSFKASKNEENIPDLSVKMDRNSSKKFTIKTEGFDDIWSDNTAIVDVQAIDVTNSVVVLEAYAIDGIANIYGQHKGKEEILFEVVVGSGLQNKKIVIDDATVGMGDEVSLSYSYSGSEKLQWGSSDPSVATVKDGVVTGVSSGVCEITCYSKSYIGTAKVTVVKNSMKLSSNEIVLKNGKNYRIDVRINGILTSNYTTVSSNCLVAFETNGIIYAYGRGTTTITFRAGDGSYQECVVVVK